MCGLGFTITAIGMQVLTMLPTIDPLAASQPSGLTRESNMIQNGVMRFRMINFRIS